MSSIRLETCGLGSSDFGVLGWIGFKGVIETRGRLGSASLRVFEDFGFRLLVFGVQGAELRLESLLVF